MYIVITPQGEKLRKEHNLEIARRNIRGTDNVIQYSKKMIKQINQQRKLKNEKV